MKHFIVLFLMTMLLFENSYEMNEAQLKAAVKMVRNVCQPKTKATNEDIQKMHQGDWEIQPTGKCYMACAMKMYKLLGKDNKLDYDSGAKQLKNLPESRMQPTLDCMNQCRDAAKTLDDRCVAAYEISKCVYFCNPENYFFP